MDGFEVEGRQNTVVFEQLFFGLTWQYVGDPSETAQFRKFDIYSTKRPFNFRASFEPSLILLIKS